VSLVYQEAFLEGGGGDSDAPFRRPRCGVFLPSFLGPEPPLSWRLWPPALPRPWAIATRTWRMASGKPERPLSSPLAGPVGCLPGAPDGLTDGKFWRHLDHLLAPRSPRQQPTRPLKPGPQRAKIRVQPGPKRPLKCLKMRQLGARKAPRNRLRETLFGATRSPPKHPKTTPRDAPNCLFFEQTFHKVELLIKKSTLK
jgi:hypothetical protein